MFASGPSGRSTHLTTPSPRCRLPVGWSTTDLPAPSECQPRGISPVTAEDLAPLTNTTSEPLAESTTPSADASADAIEPHLPGLHSPDLEQLTPAIPPGSANGRHDNPNLVRMEKAVEAGLYPIEPKARTLSHKRADESLRDITMFAVVSRMLMRNKKNTEIVAALAEAGFPVSLRTYQRMLERSDFQDYYAQYRANVLEPVDKLVREDFKLASPEAFTTLVKLMRSAKSDTVRLNAAITVLEGGGNLVKMRRTENVDLKVPPELMKQLLAEGKRFESPVIEVNATKLPAEAEPPDAPVDPNS